MVGAALHRPPLPLSLRLLAGSWPGKMEPPAGRYTIFHHNMDVMIIPVTHMTGFISRARQDYSDTR